MIVRERPEPGVVDICLSQPIECEVVKEAADASAPNTRYHVQSAEITPATSHGSNRPPGIDGEIHLDFGIGEGCEPRRTDLLVGEGVALARKDVL
jgi:hypothetical protein